jgi:hypothetical protein
VIRPLACSLLAAATVAASARADVVFSDSLTGQVGRSATIALATVARVEGQPPFTIAHPPTVIFRVKRAIRGCRPGGTIRARGFGAELPPWASDRTGPYPPDQAIDPPRAGSEYLVLMPSTDPGRPVAISNIHFSGPAFYGAPAADTVEAAARLATFSYEVPEPREIKTAVGDPVPLKLSLGNYTGAPATFDVAAVHLQVHKPAGEDLTTTLPSRKIPLRPHQTLAEEWDLAALLPGAFAAAGEYWIQLDVLGAGERVDVHVLRDERSLAFLCARADEIVRARVRPLAGDRVRVEDPIALRRQPNRSPLAAALAWPAYNARVTDGERAILCLREGRVEWGERQTPAAADTILRVVEHDQPYLVPEDERFPFRQDVPASASLRESVRRRLAAP